MFLITGQTLLFSARASEGSLTGERPFCCVLEKIKCCLSFYCYFSFVDKRGIRFSTNEVPLRGIKCQGFCTALLNLELLNYSTRR